MWKRALWFLGGGRALCVAASGCTPLGECHGPTTWAELRPTHGYVAEKEGQEDVWHAEGQLDEDGWTGSWTLRADKMRVDELSLVMTAIARRPYDWQRRSESRILDFQTTGGLVQMTCAEGEAVGTFEMRLDGDDFDPAWAYDLDRTVWNVPYVVGPDRRSPRERKEDETLGHVRGLSPVVFVDEDDAF